MKTAPTADQSSFKRKDVLHILQYIVLISAILYFGKSLFIPLSFSLLISCILYPVCQWMEKKGLPRSLAIGICMLLMTLFLSGIILLLIIQINNFSAEWGLLRDKLLQTIDLLSRHINDHYQVNFAQQQAFLKNLVQSTGSNSLPFIGATAYSFSVALVLFILIPVISSLILYYRQLLARVLYSLFPEQDEEMVHSILLDTIQSYYNFIKGMLIVYLVVGILNSVGLALIGAPHPVLFGFIASILTFIPYVGIMVASLLPITVTWITYNSIWYPVAVIAVFSIVQYLEANIIFPMAVSNRLNINTLVTIVVIIAGGILWGAAGMILFVPFLGILKLVADRTDRLKTLSILLGMR